jgi:hypothetical protein
MHTDSVENDSPPGQAPLADSMDFQTGWNAVAPGGVNVVVELWRNRSVGAEVRLRHGMLLGAITGYSRFKSAAPTATPGAAAVERYGAEWVNGELDHAKDVLTGRSAW